MVDGVVLLVDAAEGPMPQTRFVLQKALEFGHKIIIAINKIDRPDARLNEIGDEVLELLLNLDATDEQLDSPIVYCSGRAGTASMSPNVEGKDLTRCSSRSSSTFRRRMLIPKARPRCSFLLLTTTSTLAVSASAVSSAAR